jgi:hypothetical protein
MAPSLTRSKADDWLIVKEAFVGVLPDGNDFIGRPNITRVRANSVPAKLWPHLFKPLDTSYFEVEQATAGPGEKRG